MPTPATAFNALSEQLLIGRALEHASNPVALLDRGARVVWANKSYSTLVDNEQPTVRGATAKANSGVSRVCLRLQTTLGPGYRDVWQRLADGNTWSGSVGLGDADAPETIFDYILSPLPDAQGRAAYYLLLMHDVTLHHQEKVQHAHAAQHDMLTGLGNRLRLTDQINGLLSRSQAFALFYLDLDGFKGVNDTFGHATGDDVLKAFAQHLRNSSRETDLPIRLGGDEFVLVLPRKGPDSEVAQIADRIINSAQDVFAAVNPGLVGRVGVSIGGARCPLDGSSLDALLAAADAALYAAKRAGKGRFVLGGAVGAA